MYFGSAFLTSQSEIPELDRNSSNEFREVRLSVTWKVIRQDSGAPRDYLPSSFEEALTELCKKIGEGEFRPQRLLNRQDDTLDLIAWKNFSDRLPSKVIIFGQCGAGRNWTGKLAGLQPEEWLRQWINGLVSPIPLKSFFTPYRVTPTMWEFYARKAGILFDRCRIAYWAQSHGGFDEKPLIAWTR